MVAFRRIFEVGMQVGILYLVRNFNFGNMNDLVASGDICHQVTRMWEQQQVCMYVQIIRPL